MSQFEPIDSPAWHPDRARPGTPGRVLTAGEPLVVFVPERRGSLATVPGFRAYCAGAELNTAIGLARLGVSAGFACGIGADPFGERVLRAARAEGVDTTFVQQIPDGQTPVFFKQWTGLELATSVYYYRSTSAMALGLWDTAPVAQSLAKREWYWLHVTGITGMVGPAAASRLQALLQAARNGGCTISFDVNIRLKLAAAQQWRELVRTVAPLIDWYMTGDEEARLLFGHDDVDAVEAKLCEDGFRGSGVIVKCGAEGARAKSGSQREQAPAWPVAQVIDTVGAGDGFNAGFIAGLVRGWPLAEALRLGTLVGAFAVTAEGDFEGYPSWEEAARLLQRQGTVLR